MNKCLKIVLLSTILIGCNNGANLYYQGGGTQCDPNLNPDPIPTNLSATPGFAATDFSVLTSTAQGSTYPAAQSGTYTYTGSTAYFYDDTSQFEVMVSEGQNTASTTGYSQVVNCVRNYENVGILSQTIMSTQLMNSLTYSTATGIWSATADALGFEVTGNPPITANATPVTLPPSSTSVNAQSIFVDYNVNPPPANTTNALMLFCEGTCLPNSTVLYYQIRANKMSTVAPYNVRELVVYYTWTMNPPAAVKAALNFAQVFIARLTPH